MKDVIKNIIDKFGQGKIRYSVLTFGATPSMYLNFSKTFPSDEGLKRHLNNIPHTPGQASLHLVLQDAKKIFNASFRPNVKNVLVVMMDKGSSSNSREVEDASASLKPADIKIVAVSVGNESDPRELEKIATSVDDVIKANVLVSSKKLATKIMENVIKGEKFFFVFITYSSMNEDSTFLAIANATGQAWLGAVSKISAF